MINEHRLEVFSRKYDNIFDQLLFAGTKVCIHVPPGQTWKDSFITMRPEGRTYLTQAPFRFMLRVRTDFRGTKAKFFTLMCAVNAEDGTQAKYYAVGAGPSDIYIERDSRLSFFANDVPFMYWNNRGSIQVGIRLYKPGAEGSAPPNHHQNP